MADWEKQDIVLDVQHLQQHFKNGIGKNKVVVKAVDDVSFQIPKGQTFGLVGESGCGKTTTGRTIIRLYKPTGGEVYFKGKLISGKLSPEDKRMVHQEIQMIFQDPISSLNPRMTIKEIIGEGLLINKLVSSEDELYARALEMIKLVGLNEDHLSRYPHEFSGGQRQRIGIARAMVMEPELVVADEPISALDVSIRAQVLNLMKKFQEEKNLTYLFIAHDLSVVRFISDRIGVIYKGRIVEVAEAEELFNFPLHPYTHSLISAIPIPDPKLEKNKVLYTYDPSIHDYSTDQPELVCIGHDHYIYGNQKEIAEYKAIRERDIPVKPIQIVDSNASEQRASSAEMAAEAVVEDDVSMIHPRHDTGSLWYTLVSFLLPILGLIAAVTFKHFHHFRNYKACRKGAIAGFIFLAALVVIFLLLLLITVM